MKIAIVTDSTSYIDESYLHEHKITRIPLNVIFGQESFAELEDITTEELYQKMRQSEEFPKTSQPSIGSVLEIFERLMKNYDAVLCVTLSGGISGSFQTFCTAAQMVDEKKIKVLDSETSCAAQAWFVYEAVRLREEGKDLDEIFAYLEDMKGHYHAYFIADDLNHLQRGGRLSSAAALIGGLLQVKPILHFVEKKIVPFEKIRTRKKAIRRILELMEEDARQGKRFDVWVVNADCPEDGKEVAEEIRQQFPDAVKEVREGVVGPVIGAHLGPGAIAITWYMRKEENE